MINLTNLLKNKGNAASKIVFCTVFFLVISLDSFAPPPPPPNPNIPIDGGIGFLIAAGIAYGAKKSFDFKKKKH